MGALLDEMRAERAQFISEHENENTPTGSRVRLAKIVKSEEVATWFAEEIRRGVPIPDLMMTVAGSVATMAINLAGQSPAPTLCSAILLEMASVKIARVLSGQEKVEVVVQDLDKGTERLGTLEGELARYKGR